MILKGFKFGMLLQFAIGPVCIFIFQIAALKGFYVGELGVLAVTFVDGLFITVAILGLASIIHRENIKRYLKVFGAFILIIFGIDIILNQFHITFLPNLAIYNPTSSNSVFIHAVILTISNPLTIIFWEGVFLTKLYEENMKKQDICFFGLGALLSTMFFLTLITLLGSLAKTFLSTNVIQILNIIVGFLLIYFGIRTLFKKV